MEKAARFIVRHKIAVVIIFSIILLPSAIGLLNTKTNYDLLTFLPDELNSKQGQEILNNDFGIGDLIYLMVYDQKLSDVEKIKDKILEIDQVEKVDWIGDYAEIMVPENFIPDEIRENFISGKANLLQIHLEKEVSGTSANQAVVSIKEIISGMDNSSLGGQSVMLEEFQSIIDKEMNIYMLIALMVIFIILSLATASIIEPILILLSVGIAILINMGTNVFLGQISYITGSVAAILQLAVSIDYSIFLIHRYHYEKNLNSDKSQAMIKAITNASTSISGSAFTTIAGFAALMIMKMGIGKDLGFVLAKGVVFSLITTLVLLPCLIIFLDKWIEKTRHRLFLPKFNLISRWVSKYKWIFFAIIIIALVPSFLAQKNLDYYYSTEKMLPSEAKSIQDNEKIKQDFNTGEIIYVITPDIDRIELKELSNMIKNITVVEGITSLAELADPHIPESMIPSDIKTQFTGSGYTYTMVQIKSGKEDAETVEAIEKIREILAGRFSEYYVTGEAVLTSDIAEVSEKDLLNVNILSIALVALIIAVSFKSIAIPVILVFLIEAAIWFNLGLSYYSGNPVSFMTPIFIGSIQLGATIDYAILFTSRYKENLQSDLSRQNAIEKTIRETGQSIFTSALLLFSACMVISLVSSVKATGEFTLMIARGSLISMAMIFLGLPSMLLIFDRFIKWTTWKGVRKSQE